MTQVIICKHQYAPHFDTPREMREQIMRGIFAVDQDQFNQIYDTLYAELSRNDRLELDRCYPFPRGACSECAHATLVIDDPQDRARIANLLYPVPMHLNSKPLFEIV